MFDSAKEYIEFLHSVPLDFSGYGKLREKKNKVVISVGKSASYMYCCFVREFPEAAALPYLAVLPEGAEHSGLKSENVVFSSHPQVTEKSFAACERVLDFVKVHDPENAVVLLSGGSSALIEKSADPERFMSLNRELLKSGLPITEINKMRSENSLIKGGKFAAMFPKIRWSVFVMSDIPFEGGEKSVGSMPFFREDLENTELFKCADSDSLHDRILRELPAGTVSVRRFTSSVDELVSLAAHHIEARTKSLLVTGEPLLKIASENAGCGGRMSHFALKMMPFLKAGMELCALSSDGIDGNSPFAGAVIRGGQKAGIGEINDSLANYNSAELLNKFGYSLKSGYTGLNLNDFVVFLRR